MQKGAQNQQRVTENPNHIEQPAVTIYMSHAPSCSPTYNQRIDLTTECNNKRRETHVDATFYIAVADLHVDVHGVLHWSTDNHRLWPPICTNLQNHQNCQHKTNSFTNAVNRKSDNPPYMQTPSAIQCLSFASSETSCKHASAAKRVLKYHIRNQMPVSWLTKKTHTCSRGGSQAWWLCWERWPESDGCHGDSYIPDLQLTRRTYLPT